jgi:hypothetical protein
VLGHPQEERVALQRIVDEHAGSPYASAARQRLAELGGAPESAEVGAAS